MNFWPCSWPRAGLGMRAFVVMALLCGGLQGVSAAVVVLTQAHARVTVNGGSVASDVQLPYNWDIRNQGHRGRAVFDLAFALPTIPGDPWGMFLPSVGNAYEIRLNGTVLQRQGDLMHGNGADYSKVPRWVAIPPNLLQASNQIQVVIRVDAARRGGVSEVWVGPHDEVEERYQSLFRWRHNGSLLVVAFSLAVGLAALVLWWTQMRQQSPGTPRRDSLYLYAALAELSWSVAVGDALLENPPLAWPWWGAVTAAAAAAWACNMQLFCVEVAGWREHPLVRRFRWWLFALIGASGVLPFVTAAWELPVALLAWHVSLAITFLGFGAVFLWRAFGAAGWMHRLVAAALWVNLLVGIWDLWNFRIIPSFPDNSQLRFSSLFFGLSLAVIVVARFRSVSHQAHQLLSTLSTRVSQRESELRESYEMQAASSRDHERIAERSRILRDMHDGVGSHISLAIRQLQSQAHAMQDGAQADVLLTLRDALDHLKLSIDAINLPPGDITALLANLRYRLEPRLTAAGIAMVWDVDALERVAHFDATRMQHLQYMLFEAFSNVLQHAHARTLRIEAHDLPGGADGIGKCVRVRVMDDGTGFDVHASQRNGLVAMQERASTIGAQLRISSQPGQTVVEIELG